MFEEGLSVELNPIRVRSRQIERKATRTGDCFDSRRSLRPIVASPDLWFRHHWYCTSTVSCHCCRDLSAGKIVRENDRLFRLTTTDFEEIDNGESISFVRSDILQPEIEPLSVAFRVEIVAKVEFVFEFAPSQQNRGEAQGERSDRLLVHLNRFHQISTFEARLEQDRGILRISNEHSCWPTPFSVAANP